ncbi:MAG TPA: copper homeostasis protein CutC [Marmoricola sp.]|nr:copper homeostasis protein CutC [Marmoricola sp.]
MSPLLEVVCLHVRDVQGAVDGGADRLLLMSSPETGGLSPEPAVVSAVCREAEVPVRVLLRLNPGLSTNGGEFTRLVGLANDYLSMGATSFSFGFLDASLEIDAATTCELVGALPDVPWGFHRGFDAALSQDHAWRSVIGLPGLDAVATGGSSRGLGVGGEVLIDRAAQQPDVARLALACGGIVAEQVPWLLRAKISQFGLGQTARPGRSWQRSYVDAGTVRSWRTLLDDTAAHIARRTPLDPNRTH